MKIAIYPGSFDPITKGHLDILERALNIFDQVVVLLAINPYKTTTFSKDDRYNMILEATRQYGNRVKVDVSEGLSVAYAKQVHACALVRGLRAVPDFEYEFQIAAGNQFIDPEIEMVFFMSRLASLFVSSSTIKQLAQQQVDISSLVPENVNRFLKDFYYQK